MTDAPPPSPSAPRPPRPATKPERKPHLHKRHAVAVKSTAHLIRKQLHPVR